MELSQMMKAVSDISIMTDIYHVVSIPLGRYIYEST